METADGCDEGPEGMLARPMWGPAQDVGGALMATAAQAREHGQVGHRTPWGADGARELLHLEKTSGSWNNLAGRGVAPGSVTDGRASVKHGWTDRVASNALGGQASLGGHPPTTALHSGLGFHR